MTGQVAVVVVAAGRGERAGGDVPKQYRDIAGEPMIRATLRAFLDHAQIGVVQTVIHPGDEGIYRAATVDLQNLAAPVAGGATRQASVRA
ncbi:MAG: 2-C-methyl-D-erythritol 4-phosphate cytidylyltransferase, partial [Xanthobacteraceae bacterium]